MQQTLPGFVEPQRRVRKRKSWHHRLPDLLTKYHRICYLCEKEITGACDIDHYIPLDCGGEDVYENLRPTHAWCNRAKGNRMPDDLSIPARIARLKVHYEKALRGRHCADCGTSLDHRNNNAYRCESCAYKAVRASQKAYIERNKDECQQRGREQYHKHKDRRKGKVREYKKNHLPQRRKRDKARYHNDAEYRAKRLAQNKKDRDKNNARDRNRYQNDPEYRERKKARARESYHRRKAAQGA